MQYSQLVAELEPRKDIESAFLVKYLGLQFDKKGKPYLNIMLMDRSGEVEGRVWNDAIGVFESVQAKDIVRVAGKVNLYQGKKQLVLEVVEKTPDGMYPVDRFLPHTPYDVEKMYGELLAMVEAMEGEFERRLGLAVLQDPKIAEDVKQAPAAKSIHHAYIGGLLEHVLSICRILHFLGDHYRAYYGPALNKDLLILGGIFHDIGKVEELSWGRGTEYSDSGRFVGHLVQGCELIDRHIQKIEGFPEDLRLQVKHQILAHHGKLEFGSPKLPSTIEALIVHYIDDLDSKVNSIFGIIAKDANPGRWTSYSKHYDRLFYKPDPLPKAQGVSPGLSD